MTRMRRSRGVLFFLIAVIFLTALPARADIGPKRSVAFGLKNLPAGTVYAAILPKSDEAGTLMDFMKDSSVPKEITDRFRGFVSEGYLFTGFIRDVTESHSLEWNYIAPRHFKFLVYVADSDTVLLSDPCGQYAFRSSFTADLSGGAMRITRDYTLFHQILAFLGRLALTILIEVLIARLFGLRKKEQLKWIILVNIVTQLILNIVMLFWFSNVFTFYVMMFGVIELIVFIAEAMAYCYLIKGEEAPSRSRLWAYSFAANLASMLLGFVITSALPETLQL